MPIADAAAAAIDASLHEAFAEACARHSPVQATYVLSGRRASIRVCGEQLAEKVHLPFAHLHRPGDAAAADITIDLWDPAATGVALPAPALEAVNAEGNPPVRVSVNGRYVGHRLRRTLVWLDRRCSRITGGVDLAAPLSLFETGRPLYFPLMLWLRDQRVQFVHSGMVERDGRGVILCGQGGSGKSTTSLLCLLAGMGFLGDDYVGLERTETGFVGHSLFASTYVEPEHLRRFPQLHPHAVHGSAPGEDKSVVLLSRLFPERLRASASIAAVLLPQVTGEAATRIEPATRGYALRRAAPSSILQLLAPEAGSLHRIASLIEAVPCFKVLLGRDMEHVAARIDELLCSLKPDPAAEARGR